MQDVSPEALKSMMSQYVDVVFLTGIIVDHPEWSDTFYFVNDVAPITRGGVEYQPAAFKAELTGDESEGKQDIKLEIQTGGQEVVAEVRAVVEPINVTIAVFRSDAPDDAEFGPYTFKTSQAVFSSSRLEFTLVRAENPLFDVYPKDAFTPSVAPGLF